jgi:hypothetical protein
LEQEAEIYDDYDDYDSDYNYEDDENEDEDDEVTSLPDGDKKPAAVRRVGAPWAELIKQQQQGVEHISDPACGDDDEESKNSKESSSETS